MSGCVLPGIGIAANSLVFARPVIMPMYAERAVHLPRIAFLVHVATTLLLPSVQSLLKKVYESG